MNFNRTRLSALASGVALGISAMAAQAAEQPTLPAASLSGATAATFSGGATINGGASYLAEVPAADPVDIEITIRPAPADVGTTGTLVIVADVPGFGLFEKISGGLWVPLLDTANIQGFSTRTLSASEELTILDDLVGEGSGLAGITLSVFAGYYTGGDINNLAFTGAPAAVTIAPTPAPGCPANTSTIAGSFAGKPVCALSGRITSDTHLTANNSYFLDGAVFIGENVDTDADEKIALTIDAGTTLFAPEGVNTLIIDKSAKIFANGTPEKPIVMTSEQDVTGVDALNLRGTWGGLVINGRAELNTQSGTDEGEGSTGTYGGGSNPVNDDDSGAVTYVQVKYAGWPITSENELNSISLQGVGSGTILDYIQIHNGADDGIEFYGGTVNARHLLLTGNDDDALDWTSGYVGKLQYVLIEQTTSGDNCIEADNLGSNPIAVPRSQPQVSNLTCIGSPNMKSNGHAFELKAGTGMNLSNSLIGGTFPSPADEGCIRISGDETFAQSGASAAALNGTLTMEFSRITPTCASDLQGSGTFTTNDWYNAQLGTSVGEVEFTGLRRWAYGTNDNAPTPIQLEDDFFDSVDFIGAVRDDSSDWTQGWTFTGYK